MSTFKVIDPKGVHLAGKHHAAGETFTSEKSAAVTGFLHFKQVEQVEDEASPNEPETPAEEVKEDKPRKGK